MRGTAGDLIGCREDTLRGGQPGLAFSRAIQPFDSDVMRVAIVGRAAEEPGRHRTRQLIANGPEKHDAQHEHRNEQRTPDHAWGGCSIYTFGSQKS